MTDTYISFNNSEKRKIVELLERKDGRIQELERESERSRLLAEDIQKKLMETQLLLEAAETANRIQQHVVAEERKSKARQSSDSVPSSSTESTDSNDSDSDGTLDENQRPWDLEKKILEKKLLKDEQDKQDLYAEKVQLMSKNASLQFKIDELRQELDSKSTTIDQLQKVIESLNKDSKKAGSTAKPAKSMAQQLSLARVAEATALSKLACLQRGQKEFLKKISEQQEQIKKLKAQLDDLQTSNNPVEKLRQQSSQRDIAIMHAIENAKKLENKVFEQDAEVTCLKSRILELELANTEMQQKLTEHHKELAIEAAALQHQRLIQDKKVIQEKENVAAMKTALASAANEVKDLEQKLRDKEALCRDAAQNIEQLKKELAKREKEIRTGKENVDLLRFECTKQQQELDRSQRKAEQLDEQLASSQLDSKVKIDELEQQVRLLTDSQEKIFSKYRAKCQELEDLQRKALRDSEQAKEIQEKLKQIVQAREEQLGELRQEHEQHIEKSQQELESKLAATMDELRENQFNVQRLNVMVVNLRKENDGLREQLKLKQTQWQTLQAKYEKLQGYKQQWKEEKKNLLAQLEKAENSFKEQVIEKEQLRKTYVKRINDLNEELDTLDKITQDHDERHDKEIAGMCSQMLSIQEKMESMRSMYEERLAEKDRQVQEKLQREKSQYTQEQLAARETETLLAEQLMDTRSALEKEAGRRRDAELVLQKEREDNVRQLRQVQEEFRTYREAQEKVILVLEQQNSANKSKLKDYEKLLVANEQVKNEVSRLNTDKAELQGKLRELDEQLAQSRDRNKLLAKKGQELQELVKTEREQAKNKLQDVLQGMHSQDEMADVLQEMKQLKQQLRAAQDDIARKGRIIQSLRENKAEESEKANKKILEVASIEEKYERLVKESWRKDALIKEQRQRIQTIEEALRTDEKDYQEWKNKYEAMMSEHSRLQKQVKDLMGSIETKKILTKERKDRLAELEDQLEKKDSQLKILRAKAERTQLDEQRVREAQSAGAAKLKNVVLGLAEAQAAVISDMEQRIRRRRESLQSSRQEQSSSIPGSGDASSIAARANQIAMSLLNLTQGEFDSIIASRSQASSRAAMARDRVNQLKNKIDSDALAVDQEEATRTLEELIEARVQLEKMLAGGDETFSSENG